MISGTDAAHDLRLFVEDVSDSLDLRLEEVTEPVHTVEELSRMFKRFDQDHLALARPRFGQPSIRVGWSQAGRIFAQQRRTFCVEESSSRQTRRTLQPIVGRRTG